MQADWKDAVQQLLACPGMPKVLNGIDTHDLQTPLGWAVAHGHLDVAGDIMHACKCAAAATALALPSA